MDVVISGENKDIEEMCLLYWKVGEDGEFLHRIADIAGKFSVSNHAIQKLVKSHSTAYSSRMSCVSCGEPYVYKSRQDYTSSDVGSEWECNECQEHSAILKQETKSRLIKNSLVRSCENGYSLEDLSARSAVLLLALIRYSASEDLLYLNEFDSPNPDTFSPDYGYSLEVLRELYRTNVIAINPISDLDAIRLTEEGSFSFYSSRVKWVLPLSDRSVHPRTFVEALEAKVSSMEFIESHYEQVVELCKEVSLWECLSYIEHVVAEHQLSFTAGEKTKLVLGRALEQFSVGQVYNFIWRSGKDAAAFYLRSAASKKHAANTIIGNIEKQIERALANNWSVTPFRRNFDMPQSTISRVLFNSLLHTDDGGFNQVLCKII